MLKYIIMWQCQKWYICPNFTASETKTRSSSAAKKIDFRRKLPSQSREDCFSAPSESYLQDFDFEKNLALFDKKAVFEEIESANPDLIKVMDTKKPQKYRCDENVLQSAPVVYKQIKVPKSVPSTNTFVTGNLWLIFALLCCVLQIFILFTFTFFLILSILIFFSSQHVTFVIAYFNRFRFSGSKYFLRMEKKVIWGSREFRV